MRREKGLVPTKINKDMVAGGQVKNAAQIKSEGSKTPKNWEAIKVQRETRIKEGKSLSTIDLELIKKERSPANKEAKEQKPKEYAKRINIERGKDK